MNDVISYQWTVASTMSIQSGQGTNAITVLFLPGFAGNGTITVTANYGCGSGSPRSRTISLPAVPPPPVAIYGSENACPNTVETYSVDAIPGFSYLWTAPSGATIISGQGTPTVQIAYPSGFVSGRVRCKYIKDCRSSTNQSLLVYGRPVRPGLINGFASGICNGTTTYSVNPVNGVDSYLWTVPSGATINSGQGTTSISVTFPSTVNGQITVSSVNDCGTSYPRTLTVTGNIIITEQPASGTVCEDAMINMKATVPGVNLTYQWYQDGLPVSDDVKRSGSQTNNLQFHQADSLHQGDYYIVVSSTCAPSVTSQQATLTVNMKPPQPDPIIAPVYGCPGTTNLAISVPPGGYNTLSYQWGADNAVNIVSGQTTHEILVDLLPTNNSGYTIYVHGVNSCGLSKDSSKKWLRYQVSVPHIVSGPTLVCQGQNNVVYEASHVGGASSYTWSMDPGIIYRDGQGTLNLEVDFSSTFDEGQVCITASTPCFTSAPRCRTVKHDVPRMPGNISGPAYNVCNTVATYSVPPVSGAVSYDWTVPSGATIVGNPSGNSVDISFNGPIAGHICVAAVNNCTTGSQRCLYVRSSQKPDTITCSSPVLCAYQTGVVFSCTPVPNANYYQWSVPSGSVIVSGQGTTSIVVNLGANNGKVGVKTFNDCGQSGTTTYTVNLTCRSQMMASDDENTVEIYPNPATDVFFIDLRSITDQQAKVMFYDLLGKTIRKEIIPVKSGMNKIKFERESLIPGIYFITVHTVSGMHQHRLVIANE
jgi:hypothetical protein